MDLNAWERKLPVGPLRTSPVNPRYFTDDSGRAIYLTGSHTWNNFQDMGIGRVEAFDYAAYLGFLRRHNHNFFRLWVWEQAAWFSPIPGKLLFSPLPYQRTGPGTALDGGKRFDLDRFDQDYFDRLRARVLAARDQGIYVAVMLFQGFSIEVKNKGGENPWKGHPYNRENNVNGVDGDPLKKGDGRDVHTLKSPDITRMQEAYVRKVVDTLYGLDNVLWEISNESHSDSTKWQYHMVEYVRGYEQSKGKSHPILMTVQWPGGENCTVFDGPADAVSTNDEGGYKENPPAGDGRKVIITDTDHLWGIGGDFRWVWKSFLRGLNPIFMDPYTTPGLGMSGEERELTRKNMGYSLRFAEKMNLIGMTPRPDLASSRYCLAEPGKTYLIYAAGHDKIEADLTHASGKLSVEWFDPMSGEVSYGQDVMGGARQTFISRFGRDAVLYLEHVMPMDQSRAGQDRS